MSLYLLFLFTVFLFFVWLIFFADSLHDSKFVVLVSLLSSNYISWIKDLNVIFLNVV